VVAGISATGAGAGSGEGDEEKDGRLMLLHAPKKIASIEAIPRLAAVRAPPELTIISPKQIRDRTRPAASSAASSAAKRKNPA